MTLSRDRTHSRRHTGIQRPFREPSDQKRHDRKKTISLLETSFEMVFSCIGENRLTHRHFCHLPPEDKKQGEAPALLVRTRVHEKAPPASSVPFPGFEQAAFLPGNSATAHRFLHLFRHGRGKAGSGRLPSRRCETASLLHQTIQADLREGGHSACLTDGQPHFPGGLCGELQQPFVSDSRSYGHLFPFSSGIFHL